MLPQSSANKRLNALRAFVCAKNELDDAARRRLLSWSWAEHGAYSTEHGGVTRGRDALLARMSRDSELGGAPFAITRVRRTGEGIQFGWVGGDITRDCNGGGAAQFDADGRIVSLTLASSVPAGEPRPSGLSRVRAWVAANPLQMLAVATAALYLLLRLPLDQYYAEFDLSPEDAGFGTADLVLRQSARAVLAVVVGAMLFAAAALAASPTFVILRVRRLLAVQRRRWQLCLAVAPFLVFVVAMALVLTRLAASALLGVARVDEELRKDELAARLLDRSWATLGMALLVSLAIAAVLPSLLYRTDAAALSAARKGARYALRRLATSYGVIFVLVFPVYATKLAVEDAERVQSGEPASVPLAPWKGVPAQIHWRARSRPMALPPCDQLFFLGEGNGRIALYDQDRGRTIRLTSSEASLILPRHCPA